MLMNLNSACWNAKTTTKNLLFLSNSSLPEANGIVPNNVKKHEIYLIHVNVAP